MLKYFGRRAQRSQVLDLAVPGKGPMGAQVSLSSGRPSLLLEEIDHLVSEVHCEADSVQLKIEPHHFDTVRRALEARREFLIITSHYGCNDKGSRLPRLYVSLMQWPKVRYLIANSDSGFLAASSTRVKTRSISVPSPSTGDLATI